MSAGDQRIFQSSTLLMGDDANSIRRIGCTTDGELFTVSHYRRTALEDNLADDVDKTFTPPAGVIWWVHEINVTLITTATAGNRRIRIDYSLSNLSPRWRGTAGVVQAASLTRHYSFFPGAPRDAAFNDVSASAPIPTRLIITSADPIRIREINAIDPSADDMRIGIVFDEIDV